MPLLAGTVIVCADCSPYATIAEAVADGAYDIVLDSDLTEELDLKSLPDVTIDGQGHTLDVGGGGVIEGGALTLTDLTIVGDGPSLLRCQQGVLSLVDATLDGGFVAQALVGLDCAVTLTRGSVENGFGLTGGGGLILEAGSLSATGTAFAQNTGMGGGGAVLAHATNPIDVVDCSFHGNTSFGAEGYYGYYGYYGLLSGSGGALWIDADDEPVDVHLVDLDLVDNAGSGSEGGAMWIRGRNVGAEVVVDGLTASSSVALGPGAVLAAQELDRLELSGVDADLSVASAGAIWADEVGELRLTDSEFTASQRWEERAGASLHATDCGDVVVARTTFAGGIGAEVVARRVDSVTFDGNAFLAPAPTSDDGAVRLEDVNEARLVGDRFCGARSAGDGGALYLRDADAEIRNAAFVDVSARRGGAIAAVDSDVELSHATVSGADADLGWLAWADDASTLALDAVLTGRVPGAAPPLFGSVVALDAVFEREPGLSGAVVIPAVPWLGSGRPGDLVCDVELRVQPALPGYGLFTGRDVDPRWLAREDDDAYALRYDCNDRRTAVHPGAFDACGDGVDQDCDGIDPQWAPSDADQDGVPGVETCGAEVRPGGDCDDQRADVSPGAVDACGDGVDQDCDGADAGCPGPLPRRGPITLVGGRCGCAADGAPAGWLAVAALALAGRLRRRAG